MKFIDLFIELRDFCYVRAKKKYDDKYAKNEHKFYLKVLFTPYYMAILVILSGLINKSGSNLNFVQDDFMNVIIVMTPLVVIYILVFNFICSKTEAIPIDKKMEEGKYKKLVRKSNLVLIVGIMLFLLVPFLFL